MTTAFFSLMSPSLIAVDALNLEGDNSRGLPQAAVFQRLAWVFRMKKWAKKEAEGCGAFVFLILFLTELSPFKYKKPWLKTPPIPAGREARNPKDHPFFFGHYLNHARHNAYLIVK
ncbi:MAG: hypothetical protein R2830_17920 [Saprospiraceae bacterium]